MNKGRVAIVTGASRNIGKSIVSSLLKEGYRVIGVSSTYDTMLETKNFFHSYSESFQCIACDLEDTTQLDSIVDTAIKHFGQLDILINNAGIIDLNSIENSEVEDWDRLYKVNLRAPFFLLKYSLPYLKLSEFPRVVNISSNAGRMGGYSNGLSYSATKGGLISLTYGLARQLGEYGITVNCVAPGTIESDMLDKRSEADKKKLLKIFPLKRFGKVDEVAAAVLFFISKESGFCNGSVLDVNGGMFTG